jgi:hypothetical protein
MIIQFRPNNTKEEPEKVIDLTNATMIACLVSCSIVIGFSVAVIIMLLCSL